MQGAKLGVVGVIGGDDHQSIGGVTLATDFWYQGYALFIQVGGRFVQKQNGRVRANSQPRV